MNDGRVIFRNPRARFRREAYGGIVKVGSQVLILGEEPYRQFLGFVQPECYTDAVECLGQELLEQFLSQQLVLAIPLQMAKDVLATKGGERYECRLDASADGSERATC